MVGMRRSRSDHSEGLGTDVQSSCPCQEKPLYLHPLAKGGMGKDKIKKNIQRKGTESELAGTGSGELTFF